MSLRDFQRAMVDMTLNVTFAGSVRADGELALEGYLLTRKETDRLTAVARQPGMSLNCTLARANRFGPIYDVFPMTCVLLDADLKQILDNLWSRHSPENYQLSGEEDLFAKMIVDEVLPSTRFEYLEEIFRYERACYELALELRFRSASVVEGLTRVVPFQHDPEQLLNPLQIGKLPPPKVRKILCMVTIRLTGSELVAEWETRSTCR